MSSKNFLMAGAIALTAACGSSQSPRVVSTPERVAKVTTTTTVHTQAPQATGGGPISDRVDASGSERPKRSDPVRVDRLIDAKREQFRDECYSPLEGLTSFLLDVTIAPNGAVEEAKVASVNGSADVAECVRVRVMQMKFPRSVEGGVHTLTFLYGR